PVLVNYIREYNVTHGVPKAQAYNTTMYIMAGLLVIGFICNLLIKAGGARYHMKANDPRGAEALDTAPAPPRAPGGKHGKRNARDSDLAARAGVGLRRHPAHARRAADPDQRDEAVPIIAAKRERRFLAGKRRFFARCSVAEGG